MAEHLSCQQVVELVTGYLERTLDVETYGLFEEHLNFCDGCEAYLDQMRATIAVVGRLGETDVPPVARDHLLAAFRDWRGT
jgi:predicted anti-sigma-YlaC factor YlaD